MDEPTPAGRTIDRLLSDPQSTLNAAARRVAARCFAPLRFRSVSFHIFCATVLALYSACLLCPHKLFSNVMANDLFLFVDGIHRVCNGLVPHIDFVSGLGAFTFWGPACFRSIAGNEFTAFLYFHVAVLAVGVAAAWYLAASRLSAWTGVASVLYTAALLGAPVYIGAPSGSVTYAMFYNRYTWVLLIFLVLLQLRPRGNRSFCATIDSILVAVILIASLYLKASGFVAIVFLLGVFVFTKSLPLRRAAVGVAVLAVVVATIELRHPGLHAHYAGNLWLFLRAKPPGNTLGIFDAARNNAFGLLLPIAVLACGLVTKRLPFRRADIVRFACVLLGALFVVQNNWETSGLPVAFALAAVLFERTRPSEADPQLRGTGLWLWGAAVLVAFAWLPETIDRQSGVERHCRNALRYDYDFPVPPKLQKHFLVREGKASLVQNLAQQGNVPIDLSELRMLIREFVKDEPQQEIYQTEYAYTIAAGAGMLTAAAKAHGPGSVAVLDFCNPFPALLGLPPARGDYLWCHADLNISNTVFLSPDQAYGNVTYIMDPRFPINGKSRKILHKLYMDHIQAHFVQLEETPLWRLYRRR